MEYVSSDSFPVELETGEVVRIVEKQPDPQAGTVLVTDDGRRVRDDYNTLSAAYEVDEQPAAEQQASASDTASEPAADETQTDPVSDPTADPPQAA